MAQVVNFNGMSKVVTGLDTYNHNVLQTAPYTVQVMVTEVPASGMTVQIKQNGTTIVTSASPAGAQSHIELIQKLNCTANDLVSIVLASSSAIDQQANTITAVMSVRVGNV